MNPLFQHRETRDSTEQDSSLLLELDGGDPLAAEEDALAAAAASVARHVEGRLVVAALHLHHKNKSSIVINHIICIYNDISCSDTVPSLLHNVKLLIEDNMIGYIERDS